MSEVPRFVEILRQYIPKEGNSTGVPSRIKNQIRKALDKEGIENETIRGIGRRVGDYAIVYGGTCDTMTADVQLYSTLDLKPRTSRKRSKGGKSPLITGTHPSVADLSLEEFVNEILVRFPVSWQEQSPESYRWLSVDMGLMLNTQHTIEAAVNHFITLAKAVLPDVETVHFTKIIIDDNHLIGIGPV